MNWWRTCRVTVLLKIRCAITSIDKLTNLEWIISGIKDLLMRHLTLSNDVNREPTRKGYNSKCYFGVSNHAIHSIFLIKYPVDNQSSLWLLDDCEKVLTVHCNEYSNFFVTHLTYSSRYPFVTWLVMTRRRAEIRTLHLPDNSDALLVTPQSWVNLYRYQTTSYLNNKFHFQSEEF